MTARILMGSLPHKHRYEVAETQKRAWSLKRCGIVRFECRKDGCTALAHVNKGILWPKQFNLRGELR